MFNRFTKLIYITSSILIAYAAIFCSVTFYAQAALKDGQQFDDWVVRCNDKFQGKHKCFIQQVLSQTQKPEKNSKNAKPIAQNILATNFGYFKQDNTLTLVQSFPFGLDVQKNIEFFADGKKIFTTKIMSCYADGCKINVDIKRADLNNILKAKELKVSAYPLGADKTISFAISSKGLKQALNGLNKK